MIDEAGHKTMSEARLIAINNLPKLIENSVPVYYDKNHKGNKWDTITLASKMVFPKTAKEYYVLSTIKISNENNTYRFTFTSDDMDVEEIDEEMKNIRSLSPSPSLIHDGLARSTDALRNSTIFELLKSVNTGKRNNADVNKNLRHQLTSDTSGRNLSEGQSEYFSDSKVVDSLRTL